MPNHQANRRPPTSSEIVARQKADAARHAAATKPTAPPPVPATVAANIGTAVAVPDARTNVQKYLDVVAPASIVGRLIKFGKEGTFITADDGEPVPDTADFIALCDETLIGWVRFNGEDTPPDRIMGLLYDGFVMPPRDTLGDMDPTQWEPGLSGQPEDPWLHQMALVLQNTETNELCTFGTTSKTGRRAIGNLLRHYDRMAKLASGEVPVVRLRAGGFNHRDSRIGWVPVPVFAVVGRAPREGAAKPDTSAAADMNDEIPFFGKGE